MIALQNGHFLGGMDDPPVACPANLLVRCLDDGTFARWPSAAKLTGAGTVTNPPG
jgi:hypothetical protein